MRHPPISGRRLAARFRDKRLPEPSHTESKRTVLLLRDYELVVAPKEEGRAAEDHEAEDGGPQLMKVPPMDVEPPCILHAWPPYLHIKHQHIRTPCI